MSELDIYTKQAQEMIDADAERDTMYSEIDDMWHGNWHAASDLDVRPDFREVVDLSPHDALRSGTSIMANSFPKWTVQPFATNEEARGRAEKIEYVLDWHFRQMSQRGTGSTLWDIVHSALRYDAVALWLDYLPYWIGKNPSGRLKNALRNGPFVLTAHNPRFVHVRSDAYGENKILHASNKDAIEVANYWKSRNEKQSQGLVDLLEELKKREGEDIRFNHFDMMYYDPNDNLRRLVWGNVTDSKTIGQASDDSMVLMDEKVKTPFMNWIVKIGGSRMETESKYSVHPLLAPLVWSHKWKDQNITESIVYSEIIKMARAPRIMTETSSGDGVDIDLSDGSTLNLKKGLESAQAWKPAPIDPDLKELLDRGKASISSATLPRILQNPEFAGNTAFASVNAIMQSAIGTMNTAKVLCEVAGAEVGIRMFEWAKFSDDTLYAYREKENKIDGKSVEAGTEIALKPDDYDPQVLMVKCTFSAEVPTDYMQKLNAATLMVERLDYPKNAALEDLGKTNADLLIERRIQEKYNETTINADLQTILAQAQLAIQAKQMELQMQAQQAQQAAQQQAQGAPPQQAEPTPQNQEMMAQMEQMAQVAQQQGGSQGQPMPQQAPYGGQGFNENAGGMSPATGNPAVNNRETVTGQTQGGAPIA
jgi:hypothetical protein